MAKISFLSRLLGAGNGPLRTFDPAGSVMDPHFGTRLLEILKLAGQDDRTTLAEGRSLAGESAPAVTVRFAAVDREAPAAISGPPSGQGSAGLFSLGATNGGPTVTVVVDWPWQLAHGLVPITADSGTTAKKEPTGWLETYLAMSALDSPLLVGFAAETFDQLANDPAALDWAGTARDVLGLSGDFSSSFALGAAFFGIGQIVVADGSDYDLVANDNLVAAGGTLVIDGADVGDGNSLGFDGRGETDGRFSFVGGDGDDLFFGGAGADRIEGGGGADSLSGGGGADVFVYRGAGDSTGAAYDLIAGFDPAADRIDLASTVSGFGAAVTAGALSAATFDSDLAAALGNLGASQAVWFAPDTGDLAGRIFLVVDGNGRAGYQSGEDFVIGFAGTPLADLTGQAAIFI